jgi:hypothetical protein
MSETRQQSSRTTPRRLGLGLAAGAALVTLPILGRHLYLGRADTGGPEGADDQKNDFEPALQPIDAALIRYRQVGRIDTGIPDAHDIAIDGSGTLVASGGAVVRWIGGAKSRELRTSSSVTCFAVAQDGTTHVGLKDHVDMYDGNGTKTGTWAGFGPTAYLTGIALRGREVYLADSGRRVLLRADLTGKVLNEIGRSDSGRGIPGLVLPSPHLGVALGEDGTLWLNNTGRHQLENYTPDGNLERFWGAFGANVEGFIGCCNPTDFVRVKDGSFFTSEKGLARVKHYLPDGRLESVVAAPASFGNNVYGLGLAVDPAGRVLVLERGTGIVHIFERTGGGA